jgi:indole-3-glycerol phosphate synthase/phosphoribosylanthranilate isomerase
VSTILETIAAKRRERIRAWGYGMGARLPERRLVPVVPFGRAPFLICEIKRSSPTKGSIAVDADAVEQARRYAGSGVRTLSVLTEEDHFAGSLEDLVRVKEAFPHLCVLRKDFLLDERDIEVSHRAGADAVLLIARLHDAPALARLTGKARGLGLAVLFEIHGVDDLEKARRLRPAFTGFNSRDLSTFTIDPIGPVRTLNRVDWQTSAVYESGIRSEEDARFALSAGFSGLLVGEAVMRDTGLVERLTAAFAAPKRDFWPRLYARQREGRPLVKICGLTREEDADLAARLGADALGFVFAPSARRASPELLRNLSRNHGVNSKASDALKVGVVAGRARRHERGAPFGLLEPEVEELLDEGILDAVQLHGEEEPEACSLVTYPYYKALGIRDADDIGRAALYGCPRVLADAYTPGSCAPGACSAGSSGGTGKAIPENLVLRMAERRPLWLAGGLGPENVREKVTRFRPELIDASSRLEASPGMKDPGKLKLFFEEVDRASDIQ